MKTLPAHYGFAPKKEEADWKDSTFADNLQQEYLFTDLDKEMKGLTHEQKSARKSLNSKTAIFPEIVRISSEVYSRLTVWTLF